MNQASPLRIAKNIAQVNTRTYEMLKKFLFSQQVLCYISTEDEVIRKRLTVEGDGGSDNKRVMSLVKTFVRFLPERG